MSATTFLNIDPLSPPPKGEYEWNDPKFRAIPPEGIGADPRIYFNNLLMLVLESNCPPSPRGYYSHVEIAKEWIPWLQGHQSFAELAYIEESTNELTGATRFFLWRLQDWKETEQHRSIKEAEYKTSADEWWRLRYRAWRSIHFLYDHCNVGWKSAQEMICVWATQYYNISSVLPEELRAPFKALLENVNWFGDIEPEQLEEFKIEWRAKPGHLYASPYDITQEPD